MTITELTFNVVLSVCTAEASFEPPGEEEEVHWGPRVQDLGGWRQWQRLVGAQVAFVLVAAAGTAEETHLGQRIAAPWGFLKLRSLVPTSNSLELDLWPRSCPWFSQDVAEAEGPVVEKIMGIRAGKKQVRYIRWPHAVNVHFRNRARWRVLWCNYTQIKVRILVARLISWCM